jgi:aspartate/methionine/tyrosine aminotransferase
VLDPADGYDFSSADLAAVMGPRTRAIVLNSPGNPTGRVMSREQRDAVADACRNSSCWLVSDEIYVQIRFDGAVHRAPGAHPELAARTFTVGGLSKSHAMTGWRVGYVAAPESAAGALDAVLQNSVGCTSAFVQRAAVVALRDDEVQDEVAAMVAEYGRRRDELCAAAASVSGFQLTPPEGALYVWVDVSATGANGTEVAKSLLERAAVAVVPGAAFGLKYADHVRLTYASSAAVVAEACDALTDWRFG